MTKKQFELVENIDLVEFISKEAHDLKSPFNRILGFTKLVLKGMDGPINDTQKEDLTTAYKNGSYALLLLSNLIDMARLTRGEKNFNKSQTDVSRLFGQAVTFWGQQNPGRNLEIENPSFDKELPIVGDEALLRQAIAFAISYTAEHFEEGAKAKLEAEPLAGKYLIRVSCAGKAKHAPDCDLTMYGFILQNVLTLHNGKLISAEGDEESAQIEFVLPIE